VSVGEITILSIQEHEDVQLLLPWYLTGAIDLADKLKVEAHLRDCSQCRAELASERDLIGLWNGAPLEVGDGWPRLRDRLAAQTSRSPRRLGVNLDWRALAPRLGWALAAAQAVTLLVIGVGMLSPQRPGLYHALAAPAATPIGNAIVMFRSDTSAKAMSDLLTANQARIVDGPTSAGAYLLQTPPAARTAILARLRHVQAVELAEPVDPDPPG